MAAGPEAAHWLVDARRRAEGHATDPLPAEASHRRALAWALKSLCVSAWSSEPQLACGAATSLRELDDATRCPADPEIGALAHWTTGLAKLIDGRMEEGLRWLESAAAHLRELGHANAAAQSEVPKIMALAMLGRFAQAAESGEATHRELTAQGDHASAARVSLNLGSLNLRRDAYPQAVQRYREAAVLFARIGDLHRSVMADIGLGDALTAMGDFDEAHRIYARARMRGGSHGFAALEAIVDESVALLNLARGEYADALAGLERSRRAYERLEMTQHLAIAEKQLGDAYLELRLLPEALSLFEQSLTKFEALDMPQERAWTLAQRGRAQALLARPQQAAQSLAHAAALFDDQEGLAGQAAVALARAELLLAGDEASEALAVARHAARAFIGVGQPEGRARAEVVQAFCLLQQGRIDEADAQLRATRRLADEMQMLSVQERCLTGQGLVAVERRDEAAARSAFEATIELFESQRRALPGDEIRGAFLGDHLRPYQELLRYALEAHGATPSASGSTRGGPDPRANDVLRALDRFRALALAERETRAERKADDPATKALRTRLDWLYRRTLRLDGEELSAALTREMHAAEHALLENARRQRLDGPRSDRRSIDGDGPFDVETLQVQLGDDAFVEYGVLDGELFACVLTARGVHVQRRLASWPAVLEALRAVRFQVETLRNGSASVVRHLPRLVERCQAHLQALHGLIWAPFAARLARCRRVLIAPCAQLGSLPFAALHDGARPLGQAHDLALVPSARMALRGLLRKPAPIERALALGESSRLPHAAIEARAVARLFPSGTALVGDDASVARLREHAGQADIIHLACHAQFRPDNPMFSALHLADGTLTVEMAEGMKLKPAVVVLSACETALTDFAGADAVAGLVQAFIGAGAARVLATLWPVDDAITERAMSGFYAALRRGESPAGALRASQADILRTHPHPFHWAAFTLHGGW